MPTVQLRVEQVIKDVHPALEFLLTAITEGPDIADVC